MYNTDETLDINLLQ
ncbi:unnamed protein product, partial [Rotaria sp. Silwood2]